MSSTATVNCKPVIDGIVPNAKLWGVLVRKERWGLSFKGKVATAAIALFAILTAVFCIHPFLALTQRVDAKMLVVEGWVHPFAIDGAVKEFKTGQYDRVFATGGPVVGSGGYINDFNTAASVGAELLVKAGLSASVVRMVPSHVSGRDRTYSSALALRDYFQTNGIAVRSFNVLTEDVHARRTRMLFQEAFGKNVQVGIISIPDPDYDPAHWWRSSEGVREVLGESIAWVYAKFMFWPGRTETGWSAG